MRFEAELWNAESMGAWHFVTLPREVSDEIREISDAAGPRRGFGSVRVEVTVGATSWLTSVFPEGDTKCYVLPMKKSVRLAEDIELGDIVEVSVHVLP